MPRITPVSRDRDNQTNAILDNVQSKMGMVPNLISTMAQSPAVANAYLAFSGALGEGSLPARLREQIALAVGQANHCDYCLSAHTLLGGKAGLSEQEVQDARRGSATDHQENAVLAFAVKVVENRGQVSDQDIEELRSNGIDDGQIAEVIANVTLNIFTNYFNHIAETEIDFPLAPELVGA